MTNMSLPDVNGNDSADLKRLSEQSVRQVKTAGAVSSATALEMIARIRQLEHGLLIGDDLRHAIQIIDNFRQHLPLTYQTVLGYFAIQDRNSTTLGYVYTASFADWLCASANGYDSAVAELSERSSIYREVIERRKSQDVRWGGAEHDDEHDEFDWQCFITKQVNEAASADNSVIWRERMLDIAALAIAALESADRKDAAQQ